MIFKSNELPVELREKMRGGDGTVQISHACAAGELPAGLRLHAKLTLPPGTSIGAHVQDNETELFYVLQGQGEILQDGVWTPLSPGDATCTGGGEIHALRNAGNIPFVVMATIVKDAT